MNSKIILLALSAFLLTVTSADAGYIFMKNGYIIQGRVVEKDDEQVVLRWPDGTMRIELRFVDEVVLESREKEDIKQAAELNRELEINAEFEDQLEKGVNIALPDNLSELIARHDDNLFDPSHEPLISTVEELRPEASDPVDTAEPLVVEVEPLPVREERIFADKGFGLSVSSTWIVQEVEDGIEVLNPETQSRVNVHLHSAPDLPRELAREELKNMLEKSYPGVVLTGEREEQFGFERGLLLEGKQTQNHTRFWQVLIERNGTYYLLGAVWPEEVEDREVKDCLHSFHFVGE